MPFASPLEGNQTAMSKLVIVESPAKAKTISRFLGSGYDVQASFGHVRDLPESADEIPEALKKEKWAKLGVNIEKGFEPLYVVPQDKKRHVDQLKKSAKGIDELYLATDEDREGESISWHILQLLNPSSKVKVRRIVFHEITPEAIQEALSSPRTVDEDLVRAQETRRILDRLVGYTLSPLLWKKVAPKLSAGRVQSVAVRLCVMRERERMAFRSATYFDLEADVQAPQGGLKVKLQSVQGQRIASGKSFEPTTGLLKDGRDLWVDQARAESLTEAARAVQPWKVTKVESNPGSEKPPVPFMTSTLQQEANRKLGFNADRTMRIAQTLYEGIELGGNERIGLITYMRTDSLHLAERALEEAREVIRDSYGAEYLPDKPVRYKSKAKGAQEAHEAIRPSSLQRRPQDVERYLDKDQAALYELIWKRTIACQMVAAKVLRSQVEVTAPTREGDLVFGASGKQITFPGFLRAYVEGSDDPEAEIEGKETILPVLAVGEPVDWKEVRPVGHETKPPARYTEASLVKMLEDEGIGRPSTYSSIISTIQNRGYVFKKGKELVPTFTAFAVTELLEGSFRDLVDTTFTAKMESELDDIADGERDWVKHLEAFFLGSGQNSGLLRQVEEESKDIPYPILKLGETEDSVPIVVRVGRYGPFLQRGEGGAGNTANIPDDLAPADLTLERALEMIEKKSAGPEALGVDPATGRCVFYRKGRFGDYLEVEQDEEAKAQGRTPKRVTLPPGLKTSDIDDATLALLMQFPKVLGAHPENGQEVTVQVGRYGAYVKCGDENRTLESWQDAAHLELAEALVILSQPKTRRRGGASSSGSTAAPAQAPLQEFGILENAAGPVKVLAGRFGPYVTDGKTNATIPKGIDPAEISSQQAAELLAAKRLAGPAKKKFPTRRKAVKK